MPENVSAPLPQLALQPGASLTVVLDAPGAPVVTSLVIHGWQEEPGTTELDPVRGAYLPGATDA